MMSRKLKFFVVIPLFVVLGLAGLLFAADLLLGPKILADAESKGLLSAPNYYKNLDVFLVDLKELKPKLAFLNHPRTRDAGPFLNSKLPWTSTQSTKSVLEEFQAKQGFSPLVIPDEVSKSLKQAEKEWISIDSKQVAEVDTQWLHSLKEYDYWNIDKNGPADLLRRIDLKAPIPEFSSNWLKIHLIKAKGSTPEAWLQALEDVLHFGELSLTSEWLIGSMQFIGAINVVKRATEKDPSIRLKLGPWAALIGETARIKKMLWAVSGYVRPTNEANFEKLKLILSETSMSTGLCSALREATMWDWSLWSVLSESSKKTYSQFEEIFHNPIADCRLSWMKTAPWTRLPGEKDFYLSGEGLVIVGDQGGVSNFVFSILVRLATIMPNTRLFVSKTMSNVTLANFDEIYEEKRDPATN